MIYPTMDWDNSKLSSLIKYALLIDVLIPLVFISICMVSLWSGGFKFNGSFRRTIIVQKRETKETLDDFICTRSCGNLLFQDV